MTESLLLMLGLSADDARELVAHELPEVSGPLDDFPPKASAADDSTQ